MPTTIAPAISDSLFLFAGIDAEEKSALFQGGKMRRYAAGENLFTLGDPVRTFAIIGDGAVQLFRLTPDGHEMTTEILLAGDSFGETEILQQCPTHQFSARAVKPTAVMEFPHAWLKKAIQNHPTLALNLLALLARRASSGVIETERRATMTAAQQLACFLERLCVLHDYDPHDFELPYSKTLIASRLGMELETLSRALAKIRTHGIDVQGTRISFTDLKKMENFACHGCAQAGNCPEHAVLMQKLATGKAARQA